MTDICVDDTRFHVQRMGSGSQVVVFLHGLVMDNLSSFFYTLAPSVARFAHVVLYDMRGHGLTERSTSGYALNDLVADHHRLLEKLGIGAPIWLVGHSFGGLLATACAASDPQRVAGLVLLDPISPLDGWQERMVATLRLEGNARNERIAESFASWFGRHSSRKSIRLARNAEALVKDTTLIQDLERSSALSKEQVGRILSPALLVIGEYSDVRADAELLGVTLPSTEIQVVSGCTHSVLWESGDTVNRLITDWFTARILEG